jgi:hypothetical protein
MDRAGTPTAITLLHTNRLICRIADWRRGCQGQVAWQVVSCHWLGVRCRLAAWVRFVMFLFAAGREAAVPGRVSGDRHLGRSEQDRAFGSEAGARRRRSMCHWARAISFRTRRVEFAVRFVFRGKFGGIIAGEEDFRGADAVFQGVHGGAGLAFGVGAGSGRDITGSPTPVDRRESAQRVESRRILMKVLEQRGCERRFFCDLAASVLLIYCAVTGIRGM